MVKLNKAFYAKELNKFREKLKSEGFVSPSYDESQTVYEKQTPLGTLIFSIENIEYKDFRENKLVSLCSRIHKCTDETKAQQIGFSRALKHNLYVTINEHFLKDFEAHFNYINKQVNEIHG